MTFTDISTIAYTCSLLCIVNECKTLLADALCKRSKIQMCFTINQHFLATVASKHAVSTKILYSHIELYKLSQAREQEMHVVHLKT
jgi:hypothetical protein